MYERAVCPVYFKRETNERELKVNDVKVKEVNNIKTEIDINHQDKDGKTVIMYAVNNGNLNIVKLLVERKGVNVNIKDNDGMSALDYAIYNGYNDIVKYLIDKGAE